MTHSKSDVPSYLNQNMNYQKPLLNALPRHQWPAQFCLFCISSISIFFASCQTFSIAETPSSGSPRPNTNSASKPEKTVKLKLPKGNPPQFEIKFQLGGKKLEIQFFKASARGPNTRFLIDQGRGDLKLTDAGEDGLYQGHCVQWPGLRIKGRLSNSGLSAKINNPNGQSISLEPSGKSKHAIVFPTRRLSLSRIAKKILTDDVSIDGLKKKYASTATLRPKLVMSCVEYEIAVEIGSRAFEAKSAYHGDVDKAKKIAASTSVNLDKRYLHATGIKHTLGTVIIRTNPNTDPLRNAVVATGGGGAASRSLAAFRDYWNSHPEVVGKTHDLACYHTFYAPSGLAYANSVGGRQRYATVGGRGATSWADGTLCHEFGHSWGLRHTNDSGFFYESKPRNSNGANTQGGNAKRISVMVGDSGNIGRLASDEADHVLKSRSRKLRYGTPFTPPPTKPFGKRDTLDLVGSRATIDVIENDFDVNNDILDVALLDTVSFRGARLSLSKGTGPGGRNEILYLAPKGGFTGEDFFHYTVFDTSGRTDFGAVYVYSSTATVDLAAEKYNYDFGPAKSPLGKGFTRITPATTGDVFWDKPVQAADRGKSKGVNAINQDFIFSSSRRTLRHKISNGSWRVTINMGDNKFPHDQMGVIAENKRVTRNIDSPAGKFVYVGRNGGSQSPVTFDVVVKDGWLDLKFFDGGGKDRNWVVNRLTIQKKTEK